MSAIGLFYGSSTGYTEIVVDLIKAEFELIAPDVLTVHNIADVSVDKMHDYDYIIVGCPTWNVGQLQDDWEDEYNAIDELDLTGKKMAIFGLGDQYHYADNYCDAIGILGRKFAARGAELVGFTPTAGYQHTFSLGVEDDHFMGLALDEDNESEKSPQRVSDWIWQLVDELDIVHLLEPVAV